VRALRADPDFKVKELIKGNIPYLGILFKKKPRLCGSPEICFKIQVISLVY